VEDVKNYLFLSMGMRWYGQICGYRISVHEW